MTYLVANGNRRSQAGQQFRDLLRPSHIVGIPGAHNGLSALQAKAAGFQSLYLSGAAMSASMGLPDVGLITVDDVCFFIRQIVRATGLPLLVDGDTGFGDVFNVMHTVRCFEEAGAAAIHIEDQILPKKCGHLKDKKLAEPREMASKISAAVKARQHLYIIARTDAAANEGLEGAIQRAHLYLEAGADAIFPEALVSKDEFIEFASRVKAPLLANMTEFGKTPFFTTAEFEQMGYKMVIWPVSALRIAAKAQSEFYHKLKHDGGAHNMVGLMQTRAELYSALGYDQYDELQISLLHTHNDRNGKNK